MTISELKLDAKSKLKGKIGKLICILLVYSLFFLVLGFIGSFLGNNIFSTIFTLVVDIITVPLSFGFLASMIRIHRGEDVKVFDFATTGFENFYNTWKVVGRTFLKMILPIVLMVVTSVILVFAVAANISSKIVLDSSSTASSGFGALQLIAIILFVASFVYYIIKALSYTLSQYVLFDNLELTGKEIVEKSEELMKGNKGKYVKLVLSFIGWFLLIALLSIIPIIGIILVLVGYLLLSLYVSFTTISFYEDLSGRISTQPTNNNPVNSSLNENTVE